MTPTAEPAAKPLAWRRWGGQVGVVVVTALALYVGLLFWVGWDRAAIYFAGCAGVVVLATAFLLSERLQGLLLGQLERVGRLRSVSAKLADLFATGRGLLRPTPLLVGLALAVLGWACEALALKE